MMLGMKQTKTPMLFTTETTMTQQHSYHDWLTWCDTLKDENDFSNSTAHDADRTHSDADIIMHQPNHVISSTHVV